ncbi:hypothetical protein ABFX02_04G150700 [Erythranthe guttata]
MEEISIFPIVIISMFLLWSITTKWLFTKKKNFPPSPRKLPIIGNIHQIVVGSSFPHRNFEKLSKKHGPIMLLHFGSVPVLIVSSADGAREIMKTHDLNFANRPFMNAFNKLFYDGKDVSLAPYGELWRQMKSILSVHLLNNKRVQSFRSIRKDETALVVKNICRELSSSDKAVIDLSKMFIELTNNVICRSSFGVKCSEWEKGKRFMVLLSDLSELTGIVNIGDFIPSLGWISRVNGFHKKVERVAKEVDDFLEDVIQQHMETPQNSFVDNLIEIVSDKTSADASLIDRDCIKALILDVFAGGTDTVSTFLEWLMSEILRNPNVMKKLQKEVRDIMEDKKDITDDDLEKMDYMKAVIKEAFRYHPPGPILVPRVALADVKIKGYDVLRGTWVFVNVWAIGRDPDCWDEPEKFEPERFLNMSNVIDFKGLDFELIPFGAGRRGCPGIAFSTATIEFVLANLMHKFNWELPDGLHGKDLDMTESPGATVHRLVPLLAVATHK